MPKKKASAALNFDDDDGTLFEDVSEEEFDRRRRQRMKDGFVVDESGRSGYADGGGDEEDDDFNVGALRKQEQQKGRRAGGAAASKSGAAGAAGAGSGDTAGGAAAAPRAGADIAAMFASVSARKKRDSTAAAPAAAAATATSSGAATAAAASAAGAARKRVAAAPAVPTPASAAAGAPARRVGAAGQRGAVPSVSAGDDDDDGLLASLLAEVAPVAPTSASSKRSAGSGGSAASASAKRVSAVATGAASAVASASAASLRKALFEDDAGTGPSPAVTPARSGRSSLGGGVGTPGSAASVQRLSAAAAARAMKKVSFAGNGDEEQREIEEAERNQALAEAQQRELEAIIAAEMEAESSANASAADAGARGGVQGAIDSPATSRSGTPVSVSSQGSIGSAGAMPGSSGAVYGGVPADAEAHLEEMGDQWWMAAAAGSGVGDAGASGAAGSSSISGAGGDSGASATTLGGATSLGDELVRGADGSIDVFWLDAFEDSNAMPGNVFLFCKALLRDGRWVSVCLSVPEMMRTMYVLPSEEHTADPVAVQRELHQLALKAGVKPLRSKPVKRKYAFEIRDVPRGEHVYIKVKVPAKYTGDSFSGGTTFTHVFGSNASVLEQFLLKRDMFGPCWLRLKGAAVSERPLSWCKVDLHVPSYKDVAVAIDNNSAPPPLTVMSLAIKNTMPGAHRGAEVLMIGGVVHHGVAMDGPTVQADAVSHFAAVRKLDNMPMPPLLATTIKQKQLRAEVCESERALLGYFVAKLHSIDPDVIIGHNIAGYGLDVLLHRMSAVSLPMWSKLGRLRRLKMPRLGPIGESSFAVRTVSAGRLLLDTWLSAREFIRETSYGLTELARTQLDMSRVDIDPASYAHFYDTAANLIYLIDHTVNDAALAYRLSHVLMVVPLTRQLTGICGNLWSRTLLGGRAERIEYLLLHEFHRRKFVVPDKVVGAGKRAAAGSGKGASAGAGAGGGAGADAAEPDELDLELADAAAAASGGAAGSGSAPASASAGKAGRRKPAYLGGLVLEPKRGLYDKFVLLLDFNSLYPSIIQEYNICFTTVERPAPGPDGVIPPAELPSRTLAFGVLPSVIQQLVKRRREVKALIKDESNPRKLQQLDIRQKALKLTANSMYGCLGFTASRFFARPLAEMITARGRSILQSTVKMAEEKLKLEVIYGDTDSIMINTGCTDLAQVKEMGGVVRREVNALYKHLEIDIDGVFKSMLLLKKKKYAALTVTEGANGALVVKRETKGLDMVRRDWCPLSKDASAYVLDQVLSGRSREDVVFDIHDFLRKLRERLDANEFPLAKFVITKGLTKAPSEYPDAKNQPHVQVALRLAKEGRTIAAGDHVPYIVCHGTEPQIALRCYHPDEVNKSNGALVVDREWYLAQQILPPVQRLCEPIEGTDAGQLARCLGLESSRYVSGASSGAAGASSSSGGRRGEDADPELTEFAHYEPLSLRCVHCGQSSAVGGAHTGHAGLSCVHCHAGLSPVQVHNALVLHVRGLQQRYSEHWTVCREGVCGFRTRQACPVNAFGQLKCLACGGPASYEFGAEQLYNQLRYARFLFAWRRYPRDAAAGVEVRDRDNDRRVCERGTQVVQRVLQQSAWYVVERPDVLFGTPGASAAPAAAGAVAMVVS